MERRFRLGAAEAVVTSQVVSLADASGFYFQAAPRGKLQTAARAVESRASCFPHCIPQHPAASVHDAAGY